MKYSAWVSVTVLYGYFLATFPQYIVDPKLTTHVCWGARTYTHFNYVFVIAVGLFVATFLTMTLVRRHRYSWVAIPMIVALTVSIPIFKPEMPHQNLLFVMAIWTAITTAAVWIHDTDIREQEKIDKSIYLEYVKAQLQFWGTVSLSLLAAILTLVVSATTEAHKSNATVVTDPGDLFMLNMVTTVVLSSMTIYCLVGPIYQAAVKARTAVSRLMTIR